MHPVSCFYYKNGGTKMTMMSRIALFITAFMIIQSQAYSGVDEVNIALAKWGASATASSEFGSDYSAENAIDGKWMSRGTDKWNSISGWSGTDPHWLIIDLTAPRKIHKIVIRHEGVVAGGHIFNTSDYRLQSADSPSGSWDDIGRPVKDNKENVTAHEFRPLTTRFIRLLITQGEQATNDWARIFEVEVFSMLTELDMPLAGIDFDHPYKRKTEAGYEVKMYLDTVIPEKLKHGSSVQVLYNDRQIAQYNASEIAGTLEFWAPVTGAGKTGNIDIAFVKDGKRSTVNSIHFTAAEPGYFTDGTVHIISSSHQDIAWMNSPEICIRDRDKKVITPTLNRLKENPDLCFSVETTLQLMEYLERHPDKLEEIRRLTESGQLEWGATYHQPYESMYSGESLIRQVYLGRKWLKKVLPGCDSHIAWNPDVPGRAMQMPQILAKAGIDYLLMSRHEEGIYNWLSPDGSGVTAYSPGHYHASGMVFRAGIEHGEDGTTIIQKYKSFDDSAVSLSNKLQG